MSRYAKGANAEREAAKWLLKDGRFAVCVRAAGSRGRWDLACIRKAGSNAMPVLVQVKSGHRRPSAPGWERETWQWMFEEKVNASAWLLWRKPRGGFELLRETDRWTPPPPPSGSRFA